MKNCSIFPCAHSISVSTDDYFNSRLPIVTKRIAQGGVRLAMLLNRVFGGHGLDEDSLVAT